MTMKNNTKFLAILSFVFLLSACQENEWDKLPPPNNTHTCNECFAKVHNPTGFNDVTVTAITQDDNQFSSTSANAAGGGFTLVKVPCDKKFKLEIIYTRVCNSSYHPGLGTESWIDERFYSPQGCTTDVFTQPVLFADCM